MDRCHDVRHGLRVTGDGTPDLALGADGENAGDGTVLTLNGGPGGVVTESGAYCGPDVIPRSPGVMYGASA
ncbi:hypothetical protein [Streptomyces lutosisoli]|uniref:Uncharacterized protein n=1 Tax=Streptomyces lutosisoli TaxID=2665721 RepID=A0ABW2VFD1_9ACTN